jgi:hypothetical protein
VPTRTGQTAATSVRGRAPLTQMPRSPTGQGLRGNLPKSGRRLSRKALRPSWASSVM